MRQAKGMTVYALWRERSDTNDVKARYVRVVVVL